MGGRVGVGCAILVTCCQVASARATEVRAIYPLFAAGASSAAVALTQQLLETTLAHRRPNAPGVRLTDESCGPSRRASLTCLSRLAPKGLLLFGEVHRTQDQLVILLGVVDHRARKFGPARVAIYPDFPDARALLAAVALLESQAAPPPAEDFRLVPVGPSATNASSAAAPKSWKSTAGPWTLVAGVVALGAGGVVGYLDRQLDADLETRFASRALTPADGENFKRVGTYNIAANGLFIAGAILSAAGIWMWATVPTVAPLPGGGAGVFVRGSF